MFCIPMHSFGRCFPCISAESYQSLLACAFIQLHGLGSGLETTPAQPSQLMPLIKGRNSPGPAAYHVPSLIGTRGHDVTRKKSPACSFGMAIPVVKRNVSPGMSRNGD